MSSETRLTPRQARSIKTVEVILDAAKKILAEKSYEGLNTNAIAEVASVNISTLYRYFPNKNVIIQELLQQYNQQQLDQIQPLLSAHSDKNKRVELIIDAQVKQLVKAPWMIALKDALRSVPALKAVKASADQHLIDLVVHSIPQKTAGPKVNGKHQQAVMQVLVELFSNSVQMIVKAPASMRSLLKAESTLLINSYLNNYR